MVSEDFGGWKRRQEAAERHAAGDSSVWPRGLSLQMAASPSASPPSSASLAAPEWLDDSSAVKPAANQPQKLGRAQDARAWACKGLTGVRVFMGVSTGGSYWQLIPSAKQWITTMAILFYF